MSNEDDRYYNARIWASSSSSSSSTGNEDDVRSERNRVKDEARRRMGRQRRALLLGVVPVANQVFTEGDVQRGGSVEGRKYTYMERGSRRDMIMNDYFIEQPKFAPYKFRRRYRMQRELFWRIFQGVKAIDP